MRSVKQLYSKPSTFSATGFSLVISGYLLSKSGKTYPTKDGNSL